MSLPLEGSRWIGPQGLEVEVLWAREKTVALGLVNAPPRQHGWNTVSRMSLLDWERMNLESVSGSEVEELLGLVGTCCDDRLYDVAERLAAGRKIIEVFEKALADLRVHYLEAELHKAGLEEAMETIKEWRDRKCHCWPSDPVCSKCRAILKEIKGA